MHLSARVLSRGSPLASLSSRRASNRGRSLSVSPTRAVPAETTLAVTQQALAFGVVVVAEGFYTRFQLPEDDPGRPQLAPVAISCAGYGVTVGLLQTQNTPLQVVAILLGIATCAYVIVTSVDRIANTKGDPTNWPGPKAWPVAISLGASSVALAFLESFGRFTS